MRSSAGTDQNPRRIDCGLSARDHAGVFALADHQVASGASLITHIRDIEPTDGDVSVPAVSGSYLMPTIACAQMVNTRLLELLTWACAADLTGTAPVL